MNQDQSVFRGVIPPIITPLHQGRPDLRALRKLLERTRDAGCPALCIGGTVGLGPLLTDRDWIAVMEAAAEWADKRVPLLAGVMESSTPRAIERIVRLARLGYSGYLLTPTYYVTLRTVSEFHRHFALCRDAADLPMLLYNAPPCTGSAIPMQVVEECFGNGLTHGIKDSSGDLDGFVKICAIANRHGGSAMIGGRPDLAWLKQVGAGGIVPVPANVDPHPFVDGWNAMLAANQPQMAIHQARIDRLWHAMVRPDDWMRGTLYALSRQGIGDDDILPPLDTLEPNRRAAIDVLLDARTA